MIKFLIFHIVLISSISTCSSNNLWRSKLLRLWHIHQTVWQPLHAVSWFKNFLTMLGETKVASCSTCTNNSVNKRPTGEGWNNQCSRYLLLCRIFAFSHPTRQIKLTFFFYNFAFCFFLRVVNFIYLSILVMFMVLSFTF